MERYKNLGRNSNVVGYALGNGSIVVQFGDGSLYEYRGYLNKGSF